MITTYLSDGHCAEDVEEDERAVGEITAHEVTVGNSLDQAKRLEGKLSHNPAIKPGDKDS